MNITIGENLKKLRQEKGNTQENLSEFIGISFQAISKWERGEAYPDITLLPKLSAYYDISVDDLLGIGEIRKQERIDEYQKESNRIGSSDPQGQLEVWRKAQKEFPNDFTVMTKLSNCLFSAFLQDEDLDRAKGEELIEIGDKILANSTNNSYRYSAIQTLCFTYKHLGDVDKAKEYAGMAPSYIVTSDELVTSLFPKEQAFVYNKSNLYSLLDLMTTKIRLMANVLQGAERKQVLHKYLNLLEIIFEDGDFGTYLISLYHIYERLARLSADEKNREETLENLSKAVEYAIKADTRGAYTHTSILVRGISVQDIPKEDKLFISQELLEYINSECYDFCRDDEQLAKQIEELHKTAIESGVYDRPRNGSMG